MVRSSGGNGRLQYTLLSAAGVSINSSMQLPRMHRSGELSSAHAPATHNTSLPLPLRIAIQFSGHLRGKCTTVPLRHHITTCRKFFQHCDVFMHTWSELEPRTPHWRRGLPAQNTNASSERCAGTFEKELRSLEEGNHFWKLAVEDQPPPPPDDTLAPDGTPFTPTRKANSTELYWGAARHHGWLMNVRGQARAAELRRASQRVYVLALRLRPDDTWRFGSRVRTEVLWACLSNVAILLSADVATRSELPPLPPHVWNWAGSELGQLTWRALARSLHSCSPGAGLSVVGNDNCFFGTPSVLDRIYAQFQPKKHAAVYKGMNSMELSFHLPHNRPELQLTVAARIEGIPLGLPCFGFGRRGRATVIAHTNCTSTCGAHVGESRGGDAKPS